MEFTIEDMGSKEIIICNIDDILDIINSDRSEGWSDYNEHDWREGWGEWIEGRDYRLLTWRETDA